MGRIRLITLSLGLFLALHSMSYAKVLEARNLRWSGGAPACLDIPASDAHSGQRIGLYPCHNQPNQNFLYDEQRGSLQSYQGNLCLDLDDGIIAEGQRIGLWECWDGDPQKFRYESSTGLIRYRKDETFCLALDQDSQGLHLTRCVVNDMFQTFDLKNGFGERRFDELTWVTTHNTHVSKGEASWAFPNQSRSVDEQLKDGVRGFMVDTYSKDGDIHLCHGNCDGLKGFGYASPRQTFRDFLNKITSYLNQYPDAIITLFLEDYSQESDMRALLDSLPEVKKFHFKLYEKRIREQGWPTLNQMIASNERLLILSDKSDKKHLQIGYAKDFTIENYWSLGTLGNKTECRRRWDEIPMDVTYGPMQPLFVMNQFRDIPTGIATGHDNKSSTLLDRIEDKCLPAAKRKPNFVSVDFYESADRGVFKTVEILNQSVAALFQDDGFTGRAQLLQPGEINKDHLRVGDNATTSVLVFRHGILEVFDGERFDGWLGRFETSSPNIGGDLNDRISSVRIEYR